MFLLLSWISFSKLFYKNFIFYSKSNLNKFNWKYFIIFLKFINSSAWLISINNFYFLKNFYFNKEKSLEVRDFFIKRIIKRFDGKQIVRRRRNKFFLKFLRFQKLLWKLRKKFKYNFYKKKDFKGLNKKNYSMYLQIFYSLFKNHKFFRKPVDKCVWFFYEDDSTFCLNILNNDFYINNWSTYNYNYVYYFLNLSNVFIFKNLFFKLNKFDIYKFKFTVSKKTKKNEINFEFKNKNILSKFYDFFPYFYVSDNLFSFFFIFVLLDPLKVVNNMDLRKKFRINYIEKGVSNFKVLLKFFLLNFLKFDFGFYFNKRYFLNFSNSFMFLLFNKHYIFEKFDGMSFYSNKIDYNSITPLHFLDKPLRRLVFTKFQKSFTPDYFKYIYYYISSYLEYFTKKRIFFKFSSKIKIPYGDYTQLNYVFLKHRNFQSKVGRGFFFFEMLEIIWLSFFYRDLNFLMDWFIKTMERIPFKNHRKLLSVFKFIIVNYFFVFSQKSIKGFFFDIRGKVGVSGNAKKRHFSFYKGKYSKTTKNSKFDYQYKIVRTFTGALGVTMILYY